MGIEQPAVEVTDPVADPVDTIDTEEPVVLPTPEEAFAELNGARWDLPCADPAATSGCATTTPVNSTVQMDGESGKTYTVKVRIRGVVEPMKYKDGLTSTVNDRFYVGGTPDNSHYNIYRLTVQNPPQDYFLNRADNVSNTTAVIDYTVDLVIGGNSNVTLFADPQNGSSIPNTAGHTVPGITTPPELLTGQFVQMDVLSVTVNP